MKDYAICVCVSFYLTITKAKLYVQYTFASITYMYTQQNYSTELANFYHIHMQFGRSRSCIKNIVIILHNINALAKVMMNIKNGKKNTG